MLKTFVFPEFFAASDKSDICVSGNVKKGKVNNGSSCLMSFIRLTIISQRFCCSDGVNQSACNIDDFWH